jgi:serine/threonine protein kinase
MALPSWIGRSLGGRYQIESLLGQGGMSAVYKATDPNLKRVVAVKLIHPHLSSDPQFVQRFEEEAKAVASLRHPNIVQVFDFNSDQGVYYMVLEFVPGETLHDRLQRLSGQGRTLPMVDALKFTLNICAALEYAHQRGIIHRDIKPANIMLDVYGQAILMDFGIVKLVGGTSHTATGAVLGTARYISPEVIRAEPADPRSDIYSLGITLYEMLSGKTPFQSDSAMTLMMMHLNDPVPDPRSLRADLPDALVKILLKSLEKDRTKRYQTAAEMAADLKRVLASIETDTVIAPTPPVPGWQAATVISPPVASNSRVQRQPVNTPVNDPTVYDAQKTSFPTPPVYNSSPVSTQYKSAPAVAAPAKKGVSLFLILGLGAGCIFFVVILSLAGVFLISRQNAAPPVLSSGPGVTDTPPALVASTEAVVAAATSTAAPATAVPAPSATPAPTLAPTATYPPLYVKIDSITLSGNKYVVNYETFGYTEKLPGTHVHFFFNTVPVAQAGMPGSGPWYVYGGPRPFTGYSTSQRPAAATQMCALVAHSNHTIIAGSGNCVDLP